MGADGPSVASISRLQECVRRDAGLAEDRPEGAFRQIAGMVGQSGSAPGGGIPPDLVATPCMPVEFEAKPAKSIGYVAVGEPRQAPHDQRPTGAETSQLPDTGLMPSGKGSLRS